MRPATCAPCAATWPRLERPPRGGDEVGLAAARGRIVAALRRGAYAVTLDATRSGEVPRARAWLLIRDFRQATRFTRPGVDATAALQGPGALAT